eukprot:TRINITY_DN60566_c0_g1_i2.p1 TRINITY_DN60566_c0_g1~~TRINITY_DN60566_c0_g1_i2.p1  ORF type:complete len:674 (+),score=448.69 TRINITY_DN60566_c0_g1_i2:161-2182(+)
MRKSVSGGDVGTMKRQRTGTVSPDGEWEQVIDPTSTKEKKTYWVNRTTKAVAWNLPGSARVAKGVETSAANVAANLASLDIRSGDRGKSIAEPKKKPVTIKKKEIERPSDRMMKLKQALHDRTQQEEDDDDDDGLGGFEFRFAKHRHGWINRTLRIGSTFDEDKLLSFKKSQIKKALLKMNREMDAQAVQSFKNIMSYMGDRKSSKSEIEHVTKLLRSAMTSPAGLRDEIYLQLCKQTRKNPRVESTVKGWELILSCLATFPPSKALKKFLISYFEENRNNKENDERIVSMAEDALVRLDKIVSLGQRKAVPSPAELDCIKTLKPVPIRVQLLDNSFKTLQVDSYTFVQDVEGMLYSKLNLTLTSPFALYETSNVANVERILEAKERVLDVMALWESPSLQAVEGVGVEEKQDLSLYTKGKRKDIDPAEAVAAKKARYCKFLFKAKLVLKTSVPEVMTDPEAINLLYIQAVHDVVTQRYPVKDKDITVLAALQLQATYGDFQSESHVVGWLSARLHEYMPVRLLEDKKGQKNNKLVQDWEQKILAKYSRISGFTSLEAKINYLDFVQEFDYYGAFWWLAEQRQFKDYPSPLLLGVTSDAVILMHKQKRTMLESYPYTDIVTWGNSDERFIVVVGNIVQQRKLIFKTTEGKTINSLIHDYVKFKIKNKVAGVRT